MIEIRNPADIDEYSDEPEIIEYDDMPDVKPGMLCLMDTDYTSRKVVPGQTVTLHKGTPIIIKSVDKETRTVTAMDAQHNVWTFTEAPYNDFEDIDFYFRPLTKRECDVLYNPKPLRAALKWCKYIDMDGWKFISLITLLTCGGFGAAMRDWLPTIIKWVLLGAACVSALGLVIVFLLETIALNNEIAEVYARFMEHYDMNLQELNVLLTEQPIFMEDDDE